MKINILTFHNELNYGANLQAYALSYYLKSLGHEVEFIDYNRSEFRQSNFSFFRKWLGKSIIVTLNKIKNNFLELKKSKKFLEFQGKYLKKTTIKYNSLTDLIGNPPDGDIYIVGSDQVWSKSIVSRKDLSIFFLNFGGLNKIRVSYAASSGGETFTNQDFNEFGHLWNNIDFIGVREISLKNSISTFIEKNVFYVPDPTFLIDWSFIREPSIVKNNVIGIFILKNVNFNNFMELYKKSSIFSKNFNKTVNIFSKILDPFEWISEIEKCKFIVTDSYHCVLFCLYTKTPFLFVKWGEDYFRDGRVIEVLTKFNLVNCIIFPKNLLSLESIDYYQFDWNYVDSVIMEQKSMGKDFIDLFLLRNS